MQKKILWFLLVLLTLNQTYAQEQKQISSSCVQEMLNLHNQIRKSNKLEELELDDKLCEYAQKHAETMSKVSRLHHSSMRELQDFLDNSLVGENIASGQKNAEDAVLLWMKSRGHRKNILGPYKKAGFGSKEDSKGNKYWCVVFT